VPSRRSLLAAGGAAASAALAGCGAIAESPKGSPAAVRTNADLRPDDGQVVARASAEHVGCPRGDVELRAAAVEDPDRGLRCWTEVAVYPGAEECESDWYHDGVDATHAWVDLGPEGESFVAKTTSSVVYTDASDATARLQNTGNTEAGEWQVRLTERKHEHGEYAFRSTYAGATEFADGDELATVSVAVPLATSGLFGGESETITRTETLVYGETGDDGA
jgi:hypothetical protein